MKIKKIILKLKKAAAVIVISMTAFFISSAPVFATEGGDNPITSSTLFKGFMRLLNDAGIGLMIAAPIICGLLLGLFAVLRNVSQDDQEKIKYKRWMISSAVTLGIVFGASSFCTIIGAYFK